MAGTAAAKVAIKPTPNAQFVTNTIETSQPGLTT